MKEFTQGAPFDTFGLSEATLRAVRNKGYEISTPVQAGCIPPMMEGKDVIAKAPTGTGKTMAFGIPIIERIDPESEAVQAVILAPTRELAMLRLPIAQVTRKLGRRCRASAEDLGIRSTNAVFAKISSQTILWLTTTITTGRRLLPRLMPSVVATAQKLLKPAHCVALPVAAK